MFSACDCRLAPPPRAGCEALLDEATVARPRPDPLLTLGFINLPVDTRDACRFDLDDQPMKSIGVSQEWTRGRRRNARGDAIAARAEVTVAERGLALSGPRVEVAQAWFDATFAQRAGGLLGGIADAARLDCEAAMAAYRGGKRPRGGIVAADLQIGDI